MLFVAIQYGVRDFLQRSFKFEVSVSGENVMFTHELKGF